MYFPFCKPEYFQLRKVLTTYRIIKYHILEYLMPLFAGVKPSQMDLRLNPCFNSKLSCCKVRTELQRRRDQRSNLGLGQTGELIKLLATHMTEFEGIVPLHYRDRLTTNVSQFCRIKAIQVAKCNIPPNNLNNK